jgi:hypothetical protein
MELGEIIEHYDEGRIGDADNGGGETRHMGLTARVELSLLSHFHFFSFRLESMLMNFC